LIKGSVRSNSSARDFPRNQNKYIFLTLYRIKENRLDFWLRARHIIFIDKISIFFIIE